MTHRDDILFGRPPKLKVFVSSEMRSKRLEKERKAAAEAAEEVGIHDAWFWERNANAGPYSSENICLGHARTSDCLILILGETLTDITHKEYLEAKNEGAACFIFVKTGCERDGEADAFIQRERMHATYKNFKSIADLRTGVVNALLGHAVHASRQNQLTKYAEMRLAQPNPVSVGEGHVR